MKLVKRWKWMVGIAGLVLLGYTVQAQQFPQAPRQLPAPGYPGQAPEYFAANLGIYYTLVPYYGGGSPYPQQSPYPQAPLSYGARLSRYPIPGSPASTIQLEPGDMIISLDNLPINGPNDVLAHFSSTSMTFINIRTGYPQPANVYIP